MMNILFVWTGVTGYMGDCWRALACVPGVRLKILIQEKRRPDTQYSPADVLRSLDFTLLYEDDDMDRDGFRKQLAVFSPDVIFIVGWRAKLSRFIAGDKAFGQIPKILIFDLPFAWTLKKLIAPIVLRGYLNQFKACFVPGARAAEYARWLGFKNEQIEQGLFAVRMHNIIISSNDTNEGRTVVRRSPNAPRQGGRPMPDLPADRAQVGQPEPHVVGTGFLFVGRYVKEKRLDVLVKAYCRYRKLVEAINEKPWDLSCCGMGPDQHYLRHVEGIIDLGFCQPEQVASLRMNHGAFVLTSEFDPWPLVIAEACAAGLPVICTEACGSHVELLHGNGIVCKTHDVEALAHAMLKIYTMSDQERVVMGRKGLDLVKPYSCEAWSERVRECVNARMR